MGGENLMATRLGVRDAICSLRLSVARTAAPAFIALEPESRDAMMKLYARLLPRMPRPGAPVCNWWAALGQFFFSSGRSKLPARPHVVVAPRRALRGPHGSRIAAGDPAHNDLGAVRSLAKQAVNELVAASKAPARGN